MVSEPKKPAPAARVARPAAKKPAIAANSLAKAPRATAAAKAAAATAKATKQAPKTAPKTTTSRRRPATTHTAAVNRMLRATGLANVPEEAPLVALVKTLASEMDAGAGTRTRAEYLSALKDVRRVLSFGMGRTVRSSPDVPPAKAADAIGAAESAAEDVQPLPNDLAKFKAKRGIA